MAAISADSYGGAVVRRRISLGDNPPLLAGDLLTREDLKAMPVSNLRALVDNHTIEPWPWRPPVGELHVVHIGRGLYDVFEGEKLTAEPMAKEDAEALAASRMS